MEKIFSAVQNTCFLIIFLFVSCQAASKLNRSDSIQAIDPVSLVNTNTSCSTNYVVRMDSKPEMRMKWITNKGYIWPNYRTLPGNSVDIWHSNFNRLIKNDITNYVFLNVEQSYSKIDKETGNYILFDLRDSFLGGKYDYYKHKKYFTLNTRFIYSYSSCDIKLKPILSYSNMETYDWIFEIAKKGAKYPEYYRKFFVVIHEDGIKDVVLAQKVALYGLEIEWDKNILNSSRPIKELVHLLINYNAKLYNYGWDIGFEDKWLTKHVKNKKDKLFFRNYGISNIFTNEYNSNYTTFISVPVNIDIDDFKYIIKTKLKDVKKVDYINGCMDSSDLVP